MNTYLAVCAQTSTSSPPSGWSGLTFGIAAGTALVKDVNPGSTGSFPGNVDQLGVELGAGLLFAADDGTNGRELWKSDGTSGGIVLLNDINLGSASSSPDNLAALEGIVLFEATDGVNGEELWKTDGTTAGTVIESDINPGSGGNSPSGLTLFGSKVFFRADNGTLRSELWKAAVTLTVTPTPIPVPSVTGWVLVALGLLLALGLSVSSPEATVVPSGGVS
jgi:ELWxxDGT repeat protein